MPDSEGLDTGVGDVVISEKYAKNGWETFVAAYSGDEGKANKALKMEEAKWWR